MYFKRLTAQATAIAITCASSVVYADANYSQRAKEQAERAAAAAAGHRDAGARADRRLHALRLRGGQGQGG